MKAIFAVINQEGVIISDLGESPGGIFAATAHFGARFSCYFPFFVYIAHFTKFTGGSSLLKERLLLIEKSKAEESPLEKKKQTKTGP